MIVKGEELASGRVMVVDDDPSVRLTVKSLLNSEGIGVITADSGQECIKRLEAGFRGVILLDIMMPEMDGWDTIRAILDGGLLEGNVIAMLTALDSPGDKMQGLQQYVTDYVTKPFEPEGLIATVDEYLSYLTE